MFKNVCYRAEDKALLYFRDAALANTPLLYDGQGRAYTTFPDGDFFRDKEATVRVVHGTAPSQRRLTSDQAAAVSWQQGAHVLVPSESRHNGNAGHWWWEFGMPIFSLLAAFKRTEGDAVIVQARDVAKHGWLGGLSSRPVLILANRANMTCFEELIIGDHHCLNWMNMDGYSVPHQERFPSLLAKASGSPRELPAAPHVVLMRKTGRRVPLNLHELEQALRLKFPGVALSVLEGGADIATQLRVLSNCTLLITPSGGISIAGILLPPGSTMMTFGFWNTNTNSTTEYDSPGYASFVHFQHKIIPMDPASMKQDTCGYEANSTNLQFTHWGRDVYCSYNINIDRVLNMVHEDLSNWLAHNSGAAGDRPLAASKLLTVQKSA